jgi:NAD+ kinase
MRIGLFFNHELPACAEAARAIQSAFAPGSGVRFVTGDADADHGDIDCAVSIGGDGTFLMTSRTIKGRGAPLYGINMGRLGFLAAGDADSAVEDVRRIAERDFDVVRRTPITAEILSGARTDSSRVWAFNEIMIVKNFVSRPIALSTFLDGEKLYSFMSDGIIISTPTGSTAYALSAGGPIVHPDVGCVSIVPICAHSLAPRPMLVPCRTVVKVSLDSARDGAVLSGDGGCNAELATGDDVLVTSDFESGVDVIRLNGGSYADVLRNKLRWS